jgi:hypothetical protein
MKSNEGPAAIHMDVYGVVAFFKKYEGGGISELFVRLGPLWM